MFNDTNGRALVKFDNIEWINNAKFKVMELVDMLSRAPVSLLLGTLT